MACSPNKKSTPCALAFDIGNSTLSVNAFVVDELVFNLYMASSNPRPNEEEVTKFVQNAINSLKTKGYCIEGAIVSSVVPPLAKMLLSIIESFGIEVLDASKAELGITAHIDHPEEVGNDLLCDCIAVKKIFGGDAIVADLGTASKLILVGPFGDFEGCSIGAGLGLSKTALNVGTQALPEVTLRVPSSPVGKNTDDSINSALTYGKAMEIKGMADLFEKEAGRKLRRVLTGGYAHIIAPLLEDFVFIPHLVAFGANDIYRRNKK